MIKRMKDNINTWIFDLDNTLYDVGTDLFAKVSSRMTVFIQDAFQLEEAAGWKEAPHPNVQNQGSTWCGVDRPTPWWWLKANLSTLTLKNMTRHKKLVAGSPVVV